MNTTRFIFTLLVAAIFGLAALSFTAPSATADQEKVAICHRTASESNPYVLITVPVDEANGHITGTNSQHNHKVYWPTAGVYDGIAHNAGDERVDYYARDGISGNCTNGTPSSATPTPTETVTPTQTPSETVTPTESVTPSETPSQTPTETESSTPSQTPTSVPPTMIPPTSATPHPHTPPHHVTHHQAPPRQPHQQTVQVPTAIDAGL